MVKQLIDTDRFSESLRRRGIDVDRHRLLITHFRDSKQAADFSEPMNCDGLGRVRHFRREPASEWPNPLPMDPVCRALSLAEADELRAQVFQNAICNWRCWYCYVDFELLSANPKHARWVTAEELVALYLAEPNRAPMVDLSGGQPDLTPEWLIWTIEALERAGVAHQVYVWSDDNLSNDYLWRYLSVNQLDKLVAHRLYGRVACFKGIDPESFSFNTSAHPDLYTRQFQLFRRLLELGLDLYAYVTFTATNRRDLKTKIRRFVDELQRIDDNLPLRTVPLHIEAYTPTVDRLHDVHRNAMTVQNTAHELWVREITDRFDEELRTCSISDVPLPS